MNRKFLILVTFMGSSLFASNVPKENAVEITPPHELFQKTSIMMEECKRVYIENHKKAKNSDECSNAVNLLNAAIEILLPEYEKLYAEHLFKKETTFLIP